MKKLILNSLMFLSVPFFLYAQQPELTDYKKGEATPTQQDNVTANKSNGPTNDCWGTTLVNEDFQSGIPGTWTVIDYDGLTPDANCSTWDPGWTGWTNLYISGNGFAGNISDYDPANTADDYLITPQLSLASHACLSWRAEGSSYCQSGSGYEVRISTTTADSAGMQANPALKAVATESTSDYVEYTVDLSAYGGQTVYIGFWDNSMDGDLIKIDDVKVTNQDSLDATVTSLDCQYVGNGGQTFSGTLVNAGFTTITSLDLHWQVNGGTIETTSLSGLNIPSNNTYSFTHPTTWTPSSGPGIYDVKVWASNINGAADQNNTNDTLNQTRYVATSFDQQKVLFEDFTSATCPPCATYAPDYHAYLDSNKSKIVAIAYQCNIPTTGDPMYAYAKQDVDNRMSYYGVSSAPSVWYDGEGDFHPASLTQEMLDNAYDEPAIFNIGISQTMNGSGDSATITVEVTPRITQSSNNFVLRTAVIEDSIHYNSAPCGGCTSQRDFYDVLREMLPNEDGTMLGSIKADSTMTYQFTYYIDSSTYQVNLLRGVAFIQDDGDQDVHQAEWTVPGDFSGSMVQSASYNGSDPCATTVSVDDQPSITNNSSIFKSIYPNPAKDLVTINYKLEQRSDVHLAIYNTFGKKVVAGLESANRSKGEHVSQINTSNLASGLYFVTIKTDNEVATEKLMIVR